VDDVAIVENHEEGDGEDSEEEAEEEVFDGDDEEFSSVAVAIFVVGAG